MRKILLIAAAAAFFGAPAHADTQAQDWARERALSGSGRYAAPATVRSLSPRQAAPFTIRSWAPRAVGAPRPNGFSGTYGGAR